MIRVRDLTVRYGDVAALKSLSFDLAAGECLVLSGISGCGKTTLARVLSGLIPQAIPAALTGTVEVAGLDPVASSPADCARRIGTVFQNPRTHLFHLRVEDEVAFGPHNLGLAREEVDERVEWALDAVGLGAFRHHNPSALSGGQMQRLAIAAALAMRPQVLVLDEPTASLDVAGTRRVIDVLHSLRCETELTLVIVEHRLAEVRRLADQVMVLDQGRRVALGPFETILGDRARLRRYGLRRPTEEPLAAWEDLLVPIPPAEPGPEPLLAMHNLSAGYNGKAVVHQVGLDIYPGEFLAVVGENGAGKSTLALAAAGLIRPMEGRIRFRDRGRPSPGLDVGLLFQDPTDQLFTESVNEEVAFGPLNYRQFQAAIHQRTLSNLDLSEFTERRPSTLSMGQQQRTALAACLALRPKLIILDEPTLGQDWRHLQQLMEFLHELNRRGTAILLVTHDYKLVYRNAQRVLIMRGGKLVLNGRIRTVSGSGLPHRRDMEARDYAS